MRALLKKTFVKWFSSDVFSHAASLAYGTLFSMVPTLLMVIAVSGLVFGREAAEGKIFWEIRGLIGPAPAAMVQDILRHASFGGKNILATIIGGVLFLMGATTVFAQLQHSLNEIWGVKAENETHTLGEIVSWLRSRLLSLAMVAAFCFILMVSLILSAALNAFSGFLSHYFQISSLIFGTVNFVFSLGIITILFAAMFKILPEIKLYWKDVWVGAGVTAILFSIGKYLIALYISNSSMADVYGAAGSIIVVMVWVYYSSLILFFGAAFTQVYASCYSRPQDFRK